MRDILFRGYNKTLNKWLYGYYIKMHSETEENKIQHFIFNGDWENIIDGEVCEIYTEVDENSIGQITPLSYGDGAHQVYEGDILRTLDYDLLNNTVVETYFGLVKYNDKKHRIMIFGYLDEDDWYELDEYDFDDVVSNIYEKPDFFEREN